MTQINLYPESAFSNEMHRWQFCYLHGNAEFEYNQDSCSAPDIFIADAPMPETAGNYLVFINGEPAVAVIAMHYTTLSGRVALISDTEALTHALNENAWQ